MTTLQFELIDPKKELPDTKQVYGLVSGTIIFHLISGGVYVGHYHVNGYFYNGVQHTRQTFFNASREEV